MKGFFAFYLLCFKNAYSKAYSWMGLAGLVLMDASQFLHLLFGGYTKNKNDWTYLSFYYSLIVFGFALVTATLIRWLLYLPYKLYANKVEELKKRDDKRDIQNDLAPYVTAGRMILMRCDILKPPDEGLTEEAEQWRRDVYNYLYTNVNRLAAHRFGTPLEIAIIQETPQALLLTRLGKLLTSLEEIINTLHQYYT